MEWYWLTLGAAVCVFGGILFGTIVVKRRRSDDSPKFELDEVKEELCDDDGATILKRLRETDWNLEINEFLGSLDFEHVNEAQLRMFVCELWITIQKNILSLEIARQRCIGRKDTIVLFTKVLDKTKDALVHLKSFAKEVLKIDLNEHMVCAEAQTYPHCLNFMVNHGSCAELLCALLVNIPVRSIAFERLRGGLIRDGRWRKEQLVFLEHLGSPIPDFDNFAVRALDEELRLQGTSWRKIESNAKLLLESEKLFWELIMNQPCEPDIFQQKLPRESYWEGMSLPVRPELSGILANTPIELDISRNAANVKRTTSAPVQSGRDRTISEPVINASGTHFLKRKVSTWSDVQVDTEIEEIAKHLESLSNNFNAAQDVGEELSRGEEMSQSQSVNCLGKMYVEDSDVEKEELDKSNYPVAII